MIDLTGFKKKAGFIKDLNKVLLTHQVSSVKEVLYEVYVHKNEEWIEEYLKVTYDGGAYSVRHCNCDSITAIYQEIGKLLCGGYYAENEGYRKISQSPDWGKQNI